MCLSTMAFSIVKIRPVLDFRGTRDIELNEAQTMPFAYTQRKYKHVHEKFSREKADMGIELLPVLSENCSCKDMIFE